MKKGDYKVKNRCLRVKSIEGLPIENLTLFSSVATWEWVGWLGDRFFAVTYTGDNTGGFLDYEDSELLNTYEDFVDNCLMNEAKPTTVRDVIQLLFKQDFNLLSLRVIKDIFKGYDRKLADFKSFVSERYEEYATLNREAEREELNAYFDGLKEKYGLEEVTAVNAN